MAQFWTDFSEYTTGVQPTGWVEYNSTDAEWTVEDTGLPSGVTGGKALVAQTGNTGAHQTLIWEDVPLEDIGNDVEIVAKVQFTEATPTNAGAGVCIHHGGNGVTSFYNVAVDEDNTDLDKWVTGTRTNLITTSETNSTSTWYWIRERRESTGSVIKYKIWADGDAEPDTWRSTTDSSLTSGRVGLWVYDTSGNAMWVDVFGVDTSGGTAPTTEPGEALTLTPDGDGTVTGLEDEGGATTDLYASIDEGVDAADDDTTYIVNQGAGDGSAFFDLTATPSDFGSMDSLTLRIRVREG